MRVKIDIDTRTFVRFVLVLLAFGLGILAVYYLRSALTIIGISVFLALALSLPINWIARHIPGDKEHRVGATAIAYFIVLTLLSGVLLLIVPPVIEQSSKFAQTVPALIDQVGDQRQVFDEFIQQYGLQDQVDQAIINAKSQASSFATNVGGVLVNGVGATLNGIVNLLFVLVLTFLMLVEGPMWMRRLWGLYKDEEKLERHRNLLYRMHRIVTGYVNGQLIVASIAAVCTLVVMLVLSAIFPLPANLAIPLAVIVLIGGLVPLVGATIGAVLVSLILALNSLPAALIFVIYFIVYQQIENNFIAPTIQAKTVEVSALTILIAILLGVSLMGLLGALIAIPVAGCIRVLVKDSIEYNRKLRVENAKNPLKKLTAKLKSQ